MPGPLRPQKTGSRRPEAFKRSPPFNTSPGGTRSTTTNSAPACAGFIPAPCANWANWLVGILHGCLASQTPYDEATAWSHHAATATAA